MLTEIKEEPADYEEMECNIRSDDDIDDDIDDDDDDDEEEEEEEEEDDSDDNDDDNEDDYEDEEEDIDESRNLSLNNKREIAEVNEPSDVCKTYLITMYIILD